MSQFQPKQSFNKKNPPGDHRASTISVASDVAANVTRNLPPEPETIPMPSMPPGGGFSQFPAQQGSRGQMPMAPTSENGLRVEQKGMQRNLPAVRTTRQLYPNPISISIPLSNAPVTPLPQSVIISRDRKVPLVIPGKRQHLPDTEAMDFRRRHLSVRWRQGLTLLAMLGTFMIMMLSLTPLGSQSGGLSGLLHSTSVPRTQDLDLLSRSSSGNPDGYNEPLSGDKAKYVDLARKDAEKYGISPDLYVRQIQQESHFDPNAYSYVGAIGIAQFMPETAKEMGFDPHDPVAALDGGARFMGDLNNRFHGDYAKALAGYNAGPGAVDIAVSSCGGAWLSCMDPQAQAYVYIIEGQ
ncbi:lytic transglycosylase domain-containing protein [Dictyobacter halimunensis]